MHGWTHANLYVQYAWSGQHMSPPPCAAQSGGRVSSSHLQSLRGEKEVSVWTEVSDSLCLLKF